MIQMKKDSKMNLTFKNIIRIWREEELKDVPTEHPDKTPDCLPFARIMEFVRGIIEPSDKEKQHIETCPYCQKVEDMFRRKLNEKPEEEIEEIQEKRGKIYLIDMSFEISRSFTKEFYPEQMKAFEEYESFFSSDLPPYQLSEISDRFGPTEIIDEVIVPIIVGVISSFLFALSKPKFWWFRSKRKEDKKQIDFKQLIKWIRKNPKRSERIKMKVVNKTNHPELAEEVIAFTLDYLNRFA